MCTATYLPLPQGGFILSHSRDEKTRRHSALPPSLHRHGGQNVLYPRDPQGGGTWVAASARTTVCLLNGAFAAHETKPPFKHSRGLVPLHVFDYVSADQFLADYDPAGLEPFTLLIAHMTESSAGHLIEARWNGRRLHISDKDPARPHIWSSVTLYSPNVVERREEWFQAWLHHTPQPDVADIRDFHLHAGRDDAQNAIRMSRNETLMTLSLTRIVNTSEAVGMFYDDFVSGRSDQLTLHKPAYATT